MIDFQTPLSGMERAAAGVDRAAGRIAAAPFAGGDAVDLSAEMVALTTGRSGFEANVKVAQTEDQMSRSLLSILG
jgi:flagellar hook protein FlgE